MNSNPEQDAGDPALTQAWDLARAALTEITPAETIGEPAGHLVEGDGVVSLRFQNILPGYPGWHWTVSLARVQDAEPTVLEVECMPGEGSLLAPEWVPWTVRLAEYWAAQAAQANADAQPDDPNDDDSDDEDDDDSEDLDYDGAVLHSGDLDGVDIDELDENVPDPDQLDDDDDEHLDEDED